MKRGKGVVVFLLILACLGLLGWSNTAIIRDTKVSQKDAGEEAKGHAIKLGLDLSGGVSVTYTIKNEDFSSQDVADTKSQLEQRAQTFSTEYSVYSSEDRITVEIPGVKDANEVLETMGKPGSLYFIRQKGSDGKENYTKGSDGEYVLAEGKTIESLTADGSIVATGDDLKDAQPNYSNGEVGSGDAIVQLQFVDDAVSRWAEATTDASSKGESIGVYYDDHFITVPTVNSAITNGDCIIEGQKDYDEASRLATFIRAGSMKLELEELSHENVGAQLGGEALSTALKAAIIGIFLVMLFMIIMYGLSGVASSIALGIYVTGVVALIYAFEITLTLPGIAGVILGIGMAVDANVITFARIREEIAAGKPVNAAINEGYQKAFSAILDGNITTLIAAFVLMVLGSGPVKGFAYTLMISILVSMFTALVVAKLVMRSFVSFGLTNEKFYGRAKERKSFDFMGRRKIFFGISLAAIVAGFIGMGIWASQSKGALNLSLEFVGGTSTNVDMGKDLSIEEIEKDVIPAIAEAVNIDANKIVASKVSDSNVVNFKSTELSLEQREALNKALVDKYKIDESKIESQGISATVSNEMRRDAVLAVIIACFFMLLYIWFRFKDIRFASSAIIALVHDVLVVLAAYALIRIPVGNTFIACMLTVVGYSVNDTIVIFDRIRENLRGRSNRSAEELAEIANKSLTQTLSRSINTSITTIIMVTLLYILGVTSIREFALPLLVGMICGSYSSIFIATELWYVMKLHFGKNKAKKTA